MNKPISIEKIVKPEITISPADGFLSSDLSVRIDGEPVVTVHYVYPWIDNASQHAIAEKIATMFKGE